VARDIAKLAGMGSAASVNVGGGLGAISKDKVVYLDPSEEILYDPAKNIRARILMEKNKDELIALRLTMDREDQLQPIKVYPLPPELLDPKRPKMKYGVGFGHRRTLSCLLTSADSELIGPAPRKVMAMVDTEWLKKGRAYQLNCQIQENKARKGLNYVEEGQAIRDYRDALSLETGKSIPQRLLMDMFDYTEKTLGYLMLAAEFNELAKEACHQKILTDLDSLVTFDAVCRVNLPFAEAIYKSLEDTEAPRTRALIRAAKTFIEAQPDYQVVTQTWAWPDVVQEVAKPKPAPVEPVQSQQAIVQQTNGAAAPVAVVTPVGSALAETPASTGANGASNEGADSSGRNNSNVLDLPFNQSSHSGGEAGANTQTLKPSSTPPIHGAGNAAESGQKGAHTNNVAPQPQSSTSQPVVMVSFKMGDEATQEFNGELVLGKRAKTASMGVVAYLNEGREETIEVPLKHINLLSINHH
jgi:hypothetical protein